MSETLTLWANATLDSPWVLTAYVALEEKGLPYTLQSVSLGDKEHHAPGYRAPNRKVPALQHGDFWLAESTAIAEYLAETFPFPKHPRIFPEDLRERGTCRMVQAWLRTDFALVREERPSSSVFYPTARIDAPLSAGAREQVDRLVAGLGPLISDRPTLLAQWCIADVDLAMMLQRLNLNGGGYTLPARLAAYATGAWLRPSIQKWLKQKRAVR